MAANAGSSSGLPVGGVYQAGPLSGNPLAMSAGIALLDLIHNEKIWDELERRGLHSLKQSSFLQRMMKISFS